MWPFSRKPKTRTPAQWREIIRGTELEITLDEYIAGCVARMLSAQIEQTQAAIHNEKILERFDRHMLAAVGPSWGDVDNHRILADSGAPEALEAQEKHALVDGVGS